MNAGAAQSFALAMSEILQTQIELEAMKAANDERTRKGQSAAYGEEDFRNLQQAHIGRLRDHAEWIRS